MPTPYTGDPNATQAPDGVKPDFDTPPVVDLIQDGTDDVDAASINPALKQCADAIAFNNLRSTPLKAELDVDDDFLGDSINRGAWLNSTATFPDDSASGAYGAAQIAKATAGFAAIMTNPMAIASGDELRAATRVRAPAI